LPRKEEEKSTDDTESISIWANEKRKAALPFLYIQAGMKRGGRKGTPEPPTERKEEV